MELQAPTPSSNDDGLYELADLPQPTPPPAPTPATTAAAQDPTPVNASAPAPEAAANGTPTPAPARAAAPARPKAGKKRRKRSLRFEAPAWVVSLLVHLGVMVTLAAYTVSTDAGKAVVAQINSALVEGPKPGEEEVTPIYADPTDRRSDSAVGDENAETAGGSSGIGGGAPSATPVLSGVGKGVNEKSSLPGAKLVANVSGLGTLPARPGDDLGGSGLIGGDVMFEAGDVGDSLDQIAREILRHLTQHKVTVVWLFDESESMKDDQRAIKDKFDRIVQELKTHEGVAPPEAEAPAKAAANTPPAATPRKSARERARAADPLTHAIVGFGEGIHYQLEKPTADVADIGRAIDKLKVDGSGVENTLHAINEVISHYQGLIKKDRKLLIVLVTDESGDDGEFVEEAHQAVVNRGVPIYVIGRQSLFGYGRAHLRYIDPVTKDEYWPEIHRGPETADIELLQWDGLHEREDEVPSGFAPYELSRLTRDSGGIFFLLPSEENMRVHQQEKAYKIADLKEYAPGLLSRAAYAAERNRSEFRRTLYDIIQTTRALTYRREFPVETAEMVAAAHEAGGQATEQLQLLLEIQKRLQALRPLRDHEHEKRWQAHYDLIVAQIVAYQIKAYEYRACLIEMVNNPPVPRPPVGPEQSMVWTIYHSPERKAPKRETEEKYAEATKLLKEVMAKHPRTPWADLAANHFTRGLGVSRGEWRRSPSYNERAKQVPKY